MGHTRKKGKIADPITKHQKREEKDVLRDKSKPRGCPACGAPTKGRDVCDYCGEVL